MSDAPPPDGLVLANEDLRMVAHERAGEVIKLRAEIERLRHDAKLGQELEAAVVMHTHFTGDPPYVGTAGLVLAIKETVVEATRLRSALSENFCPFPVIEDKTIGACVEGGHCGCGNSAVLGSPIAPGARDDSNT